MKGRGDLSRSSNVDLARSSMHFFLLLEYTQNQLHGILAVLTCSSSSSSNQPTTAAVHMRVPTVEPKVTGKKDVQHGLAGTTISLLRSTKGIAQVAIGVVPRQALSRSAGLARFEHQIKQL
jgi:hypothetical protein